MMVPPDENKPPPPPGNQYGALGFGSSSPQRANAKAVWSLVLGVVGVIGTLYCLLGGALGIVSVLLGLRGRREIDGSGGTQTGRGMATTGIVLGVLATVLSLVTVVLVLTGVLSTGSTAERA
jgi:hypothetical protein